MSLYQSDKFEITKEETNTITLYGVEIDQHSILIKSIVKGISVMIQKEQFDEIVKRWNLFHGR